VHLAGPEVALDAATIGRQYADHFGHVHRAATAHGDQAVTGFFGVHTRSSMGVSGERIGSNIIEDRIRYRRRIEDRRDLINDSCCNQSTIRYQQLLGGRVNQFRQASNRARSVDEAGRQTKVEAVLKGHNVLSQKGFMAALRKFVCKRRRVKVRRSSNGDGSDHLQGSRLDESNNGTMKGQSSVNACMVGPT